MTPQAMRGDYRRDLREAGRPATKEPTLKLEVVKYLGGMMLAGLVSYYATLYGLREEVAVLKVRIEYLSKAVDAQSSTIARQSDTIERLTQAITAHTSAHKSRP